MKQPVNDVLGISCGGSSVVLAKLVGWFTVQGMVQTAVYALIGAVVGFAVNRFLTWCFPRKK